MLEAVVIVHYVLLSYGYQNTMTVITHCYVSLSGLLCVNCSIIIFQVINVVHNVLLSYDYHCTITVIIHQYISAIRTNMCDIGSYMSIS